MSGCATPPTQQEIRQVYKDYRADINESYDILIEACNTLEGEAKASCIATAMAWRIAAYTLANEGYHAAINKEWDDLGERRRLLEKELLEMLPNFPDIKDIFNLGGILDLTGDGQFRMAVGGTPIGGPVPVEILTYDISGDITIERVSNNETTFTDLVACSGSLDMNVNFVGLEANGVIRSGTLIANMANGEQATLTVVKSSDNVITTGSDGVGSMVFLANFEHSLVEWDSLLPTLHRVYLPVRINSENNMVVDSSDSELGTLAPFTPMNHSDYNLDGVLDYNTDYVAFLAGHLVQEDLADVNHDLVWDQEDIDLWVWDFENDLDHSE